MLPNFVIIGAQKAATTSLWHYLGQHPEVFVCPQKETDFFVAEMNWARGVSWYESLFQPAARSGAVAIGEASPSYTMYPSFGGVPERMARVIGDARLIYLLRHPVDRMVSGYVQSLTQGSETLPLAQALLERPPYADASRYWMQLEQYLRFFPPERILVLLSEELTSAAGPTLERALDFLGVASDWRPADLGARQHETAGKRVPRDWWRRLGGMVIRGQLPAFPVPERLRRSRLTTRALRASDTELPPGLRERLEDLVRPDLVRLRDYLGPGFRAWGLLD